MEDKRRESADNDVVLQIQHHNEFEEPHPPFYGSPENRAYSFSSPNPELPTLRVASSSPPFMPSPTSSSNKPPKIPTETFTRRKTLARSEFSKPKSRLVEPPPPTDASLKEIKTAASPDNNNISNPRDNNMKSAPVTPRTPLLGSPGLEDEDDDDEVYQKATLKVGENKRKKWKLLFVLEFSLLCCFVGLLVASLTVNRLQKCHVWGLDLWKWCVLILVIFCGRLFSEWFLNISLFLIEKNFLLKKKVLYFAYGLRKSVRVVLWLGLVLLTWGLLFNRGVKRSRHANKVLSYITRALGSCLLGAVIWLLKTLFVKLLASSFHVSRFFDRIQESFFHQYVVKVLSGPPLMEMAETIGSSPTLPGQLSFRSMRKQNEGNKEEVIDVEKLKKMKHEKVSPWTMKGLINVISGTRLSTLANTLDQCDDEECEQKDKEINSEWEAKAAAYTIFRNVAKPGHKYIDEDDLSRFLRREEIDNVILLFEGAADTRKIKRKALKNWLVNVYNERKSLVHSLNDTKTAIEKLNKLVSGVVLLIIIVVLLLLMGFLDTKVIVFISSQILLVAFMFGNTAKMIFEAIIFVFVMHPFDVGDRCVIDGVQMVVEEMNLLTTVFLRYDNEKIFYPNSVLATKPISNFYRSPEMGDAVEFAVDVTTSVETIGAMKAKIKAYIESKPQHWRPSFSLQAKEIENVNKMKIVVYINHTINFQNIGEKGNRRSDFVLEMKRIFEELGVKYQLLPQEVHVSNVGGNASTLPLHAR